MVIDRRKLRKRSRGAVLDRTGVSVAAVASEYNIHLARVHVEYLSV